MACGASTCEVQLVNRFQIPMKITAVAQIKAGPQRGGMENRVANVEMATGTMNSRSSYRGTGLS